MILINGQTEDRISILDRGLQYGDGVFETIAYRKGRCEWLDAHLARLEQGCKRLNITFDAAQFQALTAELQRVQASLSADAVIKIIVTRGLSGRGYRYATACQPTRIISTHPFPDYPPQHQQQGIQLRVCHHRLANQPALAGIKHLNRLDQILARNEWSDDTIAEGLMLDHAEQLIEGTMSNIFSVSAEGQLMTPSVAQAGVAGIMRAQIMQFAQQRQISVLETVMRLDDLQSATEVFVCNSLIGIWPVIAMPELQQHWAVGPITRTLQQALAVADTE